MTSEEFNCELRERIEANIVAGQHKTDVDLSVELFGELCGGCRRCETYLACECGRMIITDGASNICVICKGSKLCCCGGCGSPCSSCAGKGRK